MIEAIQPTPLDTLVFLGDYIDRGPDSRGVIEQVVALGERCTVVPLLGNQEELMLAVLEGKSDAGFWSRNFGRETLDSYGGDLKNVPPEHVQFLKDCRNYYETVGHLFVHAYYEPHLRLHQQCWAGLRWASLPPNPKPHCSGKVVIVGHTAQTSGEILDLGFLKCIDTFCHGGGLADGAGCPFGPGLAGRRKGPIESVTRCEPARRAAENFWLLVNGRVRPLDSSPPARSQAGSPCTTNKPFSRRCRSIPKTSRCA